MQLVQRMAAPLARFDASEVEANAEGTLYRFLAVNVNGELALREHEIEAVARARGIVR